MKSCVLYIKRRKKEVHVYFCKGIGFAISTNCSCHMLVLAYNTNSNSESKINIDMQVDASDIYGVFKYGGESAAQRPHV